MNFKLTFAITIGLGLFLLSTPAALAQPMRCSGEQKTCIANCQKNIDRTVASQCTANCHIRLTNCIKNGCWDSGTFKYCGLMKQ